MPTMSRGPAAPREMPERTYAWLSRTHAFFSGLQHLQRHWGGTATTRRWVLDHGHSLEAAEAEAMDVLEAFCEGHQAA